MYKIPQETEITISRKSGKFSMEIPQIVFLFNFHFDEKMVCAVMTTSEMAFLRKVVGK